MNVAFRGEAMENAVAAADGAVVAESDADVVVAIGDAGVRSLATEPVDAPVLPVGLEGAHAVPKSELTAALEAVAADEGEVVSHPRLAITVDGEPVDEALLDVMLITSEPARISEYAVRTEQRAIGSFRADGVVTSTPLGSSGYAQAAGGAVVGVEAGVSVVPVAPFATRWHSWVLDLPLRLMVERDEGEITLLADGEERRQVPPFVPVRVERSGSIDLVQVPTAADRADWKNSNE